MNKAQKITSIIAISIITVGIALVLPRSHATGTGTLTLSPSSGSYAQNTSFSVSVYENSGASGINSVEADLNYDQTKISCANIDVSTSAFGVRALANCGNGKVVFQMGNINPLTGSQLVGKINFKLLASSGSSSVTFDTSTSTILTATDPGVDVWDHNTTGGTYTVKAVTPPPPTQKKTTTKTTTGTGTTSTVQQRTPAAQQQQNPAAPVPASTNQAVGLTYTVSIKVIDSKNRAVQGATVNLNNQTTKSDSTGLAAFYNVPAGVYPVTVSSGQVKGNATITVDGSLPTTQLQEFQIKVKSKYNITLIVGIAAAVVAVIVIIAIIKNTGSKFKPNKHPGYEVPKVVVGGTNSPAPPAPSTSTNTTPAPTVKPSTSNSTADDNLLKPTVIAPGKTIGPESKV